MYAAKRIVCDIILIQWIYWIAMTWTPKHQAHAIERVRVQFVFKEPLTAKILTNSTSQIVENSIKFGFNTSELADSSATTIQINPATGTTSPLIKEKTGFVLKRLEENALTEEVGYRDARFGYVTTQYGRWENLMSRLKEIVFPPLEKVDASADVGAIRLEYWDSFAFDGDAGDADVSSILASLDPTLPNEVVGGKAQWHSHIGWFEGTNAAPVLVNRNFDVLEREMPDQETKRFLGVYTLVEQRSGEGSIPYPEVENTLERIHKRCLTIFGQSLKEDYRKMIGIELENYT